jgi:predicted transcriptional regulator|nr:CopG family transcriptional regulator [Nitrosomonas nitrosa]
MPRKTPHITVTAVVSPAIAEELDRLAKANKVTRSTLIRSLLEEKLTERANERQEDAYDRLEKRLANIENRFGGLIVKAVKMSAQSLYLTSVGLQYGHQRQEKKYLDKHWDDAIAFAGKQIESKKKQGSQE